MDLSAIESSKNLEDQIQRVSKDNENLFSKIQELRTEHIIDETTIREGNFYHRQNYYWNKLNFQLQMPDYIVTAKKIKVNTVEKASSALNNTHSQSYEDQIQDLKIDNQKLLDKIQKLNVKLKNSELISSGNFIIFI